MKTFFAKNKAFLLPYFLFLVLGGLLLLIKSKANIHIFINSFHSSFLDRLFPYITLLGDGIILIIVAFIFLFIRYRYSVILFASYLISSLITQALKHLFFADIVRPKKFFEGIYQLHFVPGVEIYSLNSFPSGHATTAFAMFFCLSLFTDNNYLKFALFSIALLTAFSRIYLSQHFFNDVYAGSVIGVLASCFIFYFIEKTLNNLKWPDSSLLKPIKKNKK